MAQKRPAINRQYLQCHEWKLVVEIDGKIHDYRNDHDELRTFIINVMGIEVIRFRNEEIENNLSEVGEANNLVGEEYCERRKNTR